MVGQDMFNLNVLCSKMPCVSQLFGTQNVFSPKILYHDSVLLSVIHKLL